MNKQQFLFNLFSVIETGDENDVRICIMEGIKNFEERFDPASTPLRKKINILDFQSQKGETALMRAAELGKEGVVDMLVQYGASVDIADNLGRTALIYAAKYGHSGVVQILVENKANLNHQTKDKRAAIHYAAIYNNKDVAAILAKNGAEINVRDSRGNHPFMLNQTEEFRRVVMDASMVYFNKSLKKVTNKALMEDKKRRGL